MKKIVLILILLISLQLLPSCDSNPEYPVTVNGVTVKRQPLKAVSLAPFITDIAVSLGYEPILVGISDGYTGKIKELPEMGSAVSPDLKKIEALKPDIVLTGTEMNKNETEYLRSRSIDVVVMPNPVTMEELKTAYTDLAALLGGNITGKPKGETAYNKLISDIEAGLSKSGDTSGACWILALPNLVVTGDSLLSAVMELSGAGNIAKSNKDYSIDISDIRSLNPDVIFCNPGFAESIKAHENYADLSACVNNRVIEIEIPADKILPSDFPAVAKAISEALTAPQPEMDAPPPESGGEPPAE